MSDISAIRIVEILLRENTQYRPVVHLRTTPSRRIEFKMPENCAASPEALMGLFFSDEFFKMAVQNSNMYAKNKYSPKEQPLTITEPDMLRFLAAVLYMGVVSLSNSLLSSHLALHEIPRQLFVNIWRNLHFRSSSSGQEDGHCTEANPNAPTASSSGVDAESCTREDEDIMDADSDDTDPTQA